MHHHWRGERLLSHSTVRGAVPSPNSRGAGRIAEFKGRLLCRVTGRWRAQVGSSLVYNGHLPRHILIVFIGMPNLINRASRYSHQLSKYKIEAKRDYRIWSYSPKLWFYLVLISLITLYLFLSCHSWYQQVIGFTKRTLVEISSVGVCVWFRRYSAFRFPLWWTFCDYNLECFNPEALQTVTQ